MDVQPPTLYPLKAGEILDRAFRLYRANFWFFIATTGVLLVPLLILKLLSQYFFQNNVITDLIEWFLTLHFLYGALTWATAQFYLGNRASVNDSYQQVQYHLGSLFGANIRQGLAYIPLILILGWLSSSVRGASASDSVIAILCIAVLIGPFFVFLAIRWGLAVPVIMLENADGGRALGRSWSLTANDLRHSFATLAAAGLLSFLIVSLPTLLMNFVLNLLSIPTDFVYRSIPAVLEQFGQIISLPLALSITVILYYDLRVRREGYDLELGLQSAAGEEIEE